MSETIKLNEGIEGAEVRDAAKWVKHITEGDINKMKIGRKGFLFSFIDASHTIAGKVFIPSGGELWHSEKEVGFNCDRLYNAFSIFKRRDKTELYINENRLFLKNGALKWRYEMEEVEQAAKIDFSKMPTPGIRLNIRDILPVKTINKGKKVSEKLELVAFKYGGGKATIFVYDKYGKVRTSLGEVETDGEGEGIALYNLVFLEKLLKDAKSGFMRIEEDKPLKLNVYTGRKTKAVLYLAPTLNSDLIEEIRGEDAPSSPTEEEETNKDKWLKEQVEREKTEEAFKETEKAVKEWEDTFKGHAVREEVIKEGVSFLTVREANSTAFHNSKEVYEDMKAEAQIDRECMWVLHLVGGNVLKKELVAMGKGNAAYVTPREVYRRAIIEGATKIIMVHNHPSGDPTPSDSDITVCETYIKAGELLGIGLLDFLVIGTQGYSSFADKGLGGF